MAGTDFPAVSPTEAAAAEPLLIHATYGHTWRAADIIALQPRRGIVLADRDRQHCIALVRVTGDEAELLDIGVREAMQRRGLGTALLAAAEDAAATLGARRILLEVALDNDTARSLYDRAGYAEAGRRPAYYRRPGGGRMDALLLAKPLRPAP